MEIPTLMALLKGRKCREAVELSAKLTEGLHQQASDSFSKKGGVVMENKGKKDYGFTGYNPHLRDTARCLRHRMTPQECRLWYGFLRKYPVKWYRQREIDRFIVDFYCSKAKLAIELDGSHHYTQQGHAHDAERNAILTQHGISVLHISNTELEQNFYGICRLIDHKVKNSE
ncbi:MAG: endonuclease domain-containing protein [Clostridiales bacterium]|nr:endonuclease domain-containing protein [Clostridiales bacterium]